jgi:hypothetical protein
MDEACRMGLRQPFRDLAGEPHGPGQRQEPLTQQLIERLPLDQLHHDPVAVRSLDDLVDVDDSRGG